MGHRVIEFQQGQNLLRSFMMLSVYKRQTPNGLPGRKKPRPGVKKQSGWTTEFRVLKSNPVPLISWVVTSNIFGIFTPKLGEDFPFDDHIFQMGGSTTNMFPNAKEQEKHAAKISGANPWCWGQAK